MPLFFLVSSVLVTKRFLFGTGVEIFHVLSTFQNIGKLYGQKRTETISVTDLVGSTPSGECYHYNHAEIRAAGEETFLLQSRANM